MVTSEIGRRAARIAMVLTDNDGVLTDGRVWLSPGGEEMLAYSRRDGMGVQRLRERGVATAIVTREQSAIVLRRAEKLELPHVWLGVREKRAYLARILAETGLQVEQLAYIGDDVNDLSLSRPSARRASPRRPPTPFLRSSARFTTSATPPGGAAHSAR